jgi:hypothetical protein
LAGPYRIQYVPPSRKLEMAGASAKAATPPAYESYLDRLMRMVPSEVVALYLVGAGFIPKTDRIVLAIWSVVCLGGVVAIRALGSRDVKAGKGPQWGSVAISSTAFVVWLYSLGGPFAAFGVYVPYIGSLLVLAWTFFIPLFYKGELLTVADRR